MNEYISLDFMVPVMGERVRNLTKRKPAAFDAYYPRRYVEPATHYSPKAAALLHALATNLTPMLNASHKQELWEMVNAGRLAKNRMPTWWVSSELLLALAQTTPPSAIRWEDIPWPVPAVQFMLPIKESRELFGRSVPCISGSIGAAREEVVLPADDECKRHRLCLAPAREATLNSIVIAAPCYYMDGECDGTLSMHAPVTPGLTVGKVMVNEWPEGFEVSAGAAVDNTDKVRLDQFISIFVQLLMLLGMKGDSMVTGGDCVLGAKTEGKGENKKVIRPSLFATRWVGEKFKRDPKPPQGGTHASPEMHLRAGHWRDQRVGKGRTAFKAVWIKPVWINAPKEEANVK